MSSSGIQACMEAMQWQHDARRAHNTLGVYYITRYGKMFKLEYMCVYWYVVTVLVHVGVQN